MTGTTDNTAIPPARAGSPVQCKKVELQLLTTLKCNLRCSYCSLGVGDVLGSQKKASYSVEQLAVFIDTHLFDREVYITLYGGEPTLNIGFAERLMERLPGMRFNLQTNGTLLHRVPHAVLARLANVLVSIDGGEAITDSHRGKGVYRKVLANVERIRARVPGTLTARVTWSSPETSFEDFDRLTRIFDNVYFQFAQQEGAYTPAAMVSKKAVLARLVRNFFETEGLYRIVPIMGTVRNKVLPERIQELCAGKTQCRVSSNLLNVMPDGRIFPCPDMLYRPELQQGDVVANWVRPSALQLNASMPCQDCRAYHFCRGNCMKNLYLSYVQGEAGWRSQVTEPTCELIRFMGDEVDRHDPHGWFARAPEPKRHELAHAPIYEFCEVMP